jgi:hypothetical protein
MLRTGTNICHIDSCGHKECRAAHACKGVEFRLNHAPDYIKQKALALAYEAAQWGIVLTIEQVPLQPLAMRNYETVVSVRRFRE